MALPPLRPSSSSSSSSHCLRRPQRGELQLARRLAFGLEDRVGGQRQSTRSSGSSSSNLFCRRIVFSSPSCAAKRSSPISDWTASSFCEPPFLSGRRRSAHFLQTKKERKKEEESLMSAMKVNILTSEEEEEDSCVYY